ncbi:hypothetical protein [Deinococcus altitudinis]|uniref:hypothetical protein n=1 Tax=Deinococcus altitudinis TaxID=468914 RepID=UPI0038917488
MKKPLFLENFPPISESSPVDLLTLDSEARPMPRHRDNSRPALATSGQTIQRQPATAREYAEAWYQCLREPETHVEPVMISTSTGGTFVADLDVGNWRSGGGQTYVRTPAGFRDERAIGKAVYDMLESKRPDDVLYGKLLGRVITGVSVSSLLREGGWVSPRERSLRYALACLTLAIQVGDRVAEEPLREIRLMLSPG